VVRDETFAFQHLWQEPMKMPEQGEFIWPSAAKSPVWLVKSSQNTKIGGDIKGMLHYITQRHVTIIIKIP
jgi:hypothetical protein